MNPEFTIVTGVPRSGTSLQMQTLKCLGLDLAGDEYPQLRRIEKIILDKNLKGSEFPGLEGYPEGPIFDESGNVLGFKIRDQFYDINLHEEFSNFLRAQEMNPRGFYELIDSVMRGVQDENLIRNKAVKIIVDGIPEKKMKRKKEGGEIEEITIGTKEYILDRAKIILCLRDPRNVSVSQKNLISNVEIVNSNNKFEDINKFSPENPTRFVIEMGRFYCWLRERPLTFLTVDYDDMQNDPKGQVDRITGFLGIMPTEEQRSAAIGNVSPELKRSINFEGWTEDVKEEGELAIRLYQYFRDGEEDHLFDSIKKFLENLNIESARWVDTEFGLWALSNTTFHRQLKGNLRGIRDKMVVSYRRRKNQTFCEHFSRSDEEYTILRPADLGNLVRVGVRCLKDDEDKTIEQCFRCFHQDKLF